MASLFISAYLFHDSNILKLANVYHQLFEIQEIWSSPPKIYGSILAAITCLNLIIIINITIRPVTMNGAKAQNASFLSKSSSQNLNALKLLEKFSLNFLFTTSFDPFSLKISFYDRRN